MFNATFFFYAYESTAATIPSGLLGKIDASVATDLSNMFTYSFSFYGYQSTIAAIPSGLFGSINTGKATDFAYMFSSTFSGYASNSVGATIPAGLFDSIDTTNASDLASMFDSTFVLCAEVSTTATIPTNLFDRLTIPPGVDTSGMFAGTFTEYARRTARFSVNGSVLPFTQTFTNPYSVKAGTSGTPSDDPTVSAGDVVYPTYNNRLRTIDNPTSSNPAYATYIWYRKDGTSCAVSSPKPDCGPQNSASLAVLPDSTEWMPTTSTEKGSVVFYGRIPQPMSIKSITPDGGPTSGGTNVTIIGVSFGDSPSSPSVSVGNSACLIESWSDTKITCVTGAHVAGVVDVTVNGDGESASLTRAYAYFDRYEGKPLVPRAPDTGMLAD
jgi:hypothetical protein